MEDMRAEVAPPAAAEAEEVVPESDRLVRALRALEGLDAIRSIVSARPQLVRQWDASGWLPLHEAILFYNPPDVISYLLDEWPESIHMKSYARDDEASQLPIHMACSLLKDDETNEETKIRLQTVRILVERWPESLHTQRDHDGWLPLHAARRADIVKYLVQACPAAVREQDRHGKIPLHHAVEEGWDEDVIGAIECLVHEWPESVQARDHEGRLALHYIHSRTPVDVVRVLVRHWTESVREKDGEGFLPLHRWLRNGLVDVQPVDPTLVFLVEQWPPAIRETSSERYLPLHVAIYGSQPLRTIQYLVQLWPESIRERSNTSGYLPVHESARRGSVETARFLLDRWPESVHETVTGTGFTVLHLAVQGHHVDMATFLVRSWPGLARVRSTDGRLPIHMAVQYRPEFPSDHPYHREEVLAVARILVGACRGSLWDETSIEGYIPLHSALTRVNSDIIQEEAREVAKRAEADFVQFLVRQAPSTVRMATKDGRLPVQLAISTGISPSSVRQLVARWPLSLDVTTPQGSSALHLALARDEPSLELVQYLVEERPEFLRHIDTLGRTPVHVAVAHDQPLEVVRLMVDLWPQALDVTDTTGSLPLHVIAARGSPRMDVVRFLVEMRPQSVNATDGSGSLPLHISVSCGEGSSAELVRFLLEQSPQSVHQKDGRGWIALFVAAKTDAPLDVLFVLAKKWPGAVSG